jgi:hypothetical protein
MPSPQKAKGASWEREISQFLTDRYGEHFMRAPGSGAYVGGTNSVRKQVMHENTIRVFKGDIVPGESFSKLNIEAKSYKDFPFHQLFLNKTVKQLEDWIDQAMTVADPDDLTMLFLKFTRKGTFIVTQTRPLFMAPAGSIQYQSEKYGTWIFSELNGFFELNSHHVKTYSQNTHTSA